MTVCKENVTLPRRCRSTEDRTSHDFLASHNKDSHEMYSCRAQFYSNDARCDHCKSSSSEEWAGLQSYNDKLASQHAAPCKEVSLGSMAAKSSRVEAVKQLVCKAGLCEEDAEVVATDSGNPHVVEGMFFHARPLFSK